jgi:hypothetical protein
LTIHELSVCIAIGLAGGALGGFLGIGGSLVMIPALTLAFGPDQHLYQAAAMVVNLFVALSAVIRHLRAGAVHRKALIGMAPTALVCIAIGVIASNMFDGILLAQVFAVLLVYVIVVNVRKIAAQMHGQRRAGNASGIVPRAAAHESTKGTITWPRSLFVGSVTGFFAGMLGIGGGGIAVPLQQVVFRAPLRQCIGTSTALICVTAGVGALLKNLTLAEHGYSFWSNSFPLIAALGPSAVVGAYLGAALTHRLPTLWVRVAFVLLLSAAGLKMAGWY